MSFFIYITIFGFYLINSLQSCGITTHTEIAHRATHNYEYLLDNQTSVAKLIQKYQSAFQAGNPYPDSFYPNLCKKGTLHDVSEDTHWVPFLNATIKYIQNKYKKPYNEDAFRLIVFTLGYVSHQMADITWHSLGVSQGFLSAMGFVNFHGSFDQAHSVGDFGGDVVNQFELNTKYIADLGEWYVPYDDLYNIYLEYYGEERITRSTIIECSSALFLGRLGEQIAVSLLYADYFKKSIFLADRLNDYFLGGLDDMATWTQLSWNKVFYMLENGVEKCKLDHNIMFIDCNTNNTQVELVKKYKSVPPKFRIDEYGLDRSYLNMTILPKGLIIKSNKKFDDYFNNNFLSIANWNKKFYDLPNKLESKPAFSNASYYSLNDYSNLGWSLASADLNNDGSDDLIMGAPVHSELNMYQNGAVFIVLSTKTGTIPLKNMNIENNADLILKPPSDAVSSRFGHSVTVIDINLDGFNDLVISAPSYNLGNIKYEGVVYIYLGDSSYKYENLSIVIRCKNLQYCNLGWTISKGDVNSDKLDDLIISSPYAATCDSQCGFVSVLFAKETTFNKEIDVENLDWFINGHMAYEWFGFSAKAKLGFLVVGAPQSRICADPNCDISQKDVQAVGRVYVYQYPLKTPISSLTGQFEFEQFGYDFDLSYQQKYPIIAISSVTKESKLDNKTSFNLYHGGIVEIFRIDNLAKPTLISVLKSDRPYSAFGSRIKFFSNNNSMIEDLYVSAQMRSESLVLIDQIQEGSVYMFKGNTLIGNITDICPAIDLTPCPSNHAQIVFKNDQKRARFGFDFTFLKSRDYEFLNLAISSIHADNQNSRLSGKVGVFLVN